MHTRRRLVHAAALLAAFGLGAAVAPPRPATGQVPVAPPEFLPNRGLDAALYVHTAAEYRACCLQAYAVAEERLAAFKTTAPAGKPPAVVLDLDETVFDNGGFQAAQVRGGRDYDPRAWDLWEEKPDGVELVPGAKAFVLAADKMGVRPVYLSNRLAKNAATVRAALKRLGLPAVTDGQLHLATKTSDKTDRRKEVEAAYQVLMYVGDNLRDFDEAYRFADLSRAAGKDLDAAIAARKDRVDADRAAWGRRWIVLPNPTYGEWAKPFGRGRDDLDRLAK